MSLSGIRSRLLHLTLLVALCGWGPGAASQQSGSTGTGTSGIETSSEAEKKSTPPVKTAPGKIKDSFTPSEEVSEDLSVSFPVDI